MARKSYEIEGQLDFFDLLFSEDKTKEKTIKARDASQFVECENCWCRDCKHNSMNEGEPRDLCGEMKACPACEICAKNDNPEICKIGSAKEGCSLRAREEGMIQEDTD